MTTRRRFMQIAACSALPASTAAFAVADAASPARRFPTGVRAVVVDTGLAATRAFGRHFAIRGVPVLSIAESDVTAVWLDTIRPAWQRNAASIAGLTAPAALFCLEQLAWSHGLRVVFHAEHTVRADGIAEHHVQRGGLLADRAAATLVSAGPDWSARLAETIATQPVSLRKQRFGPSIAALEPALPAGARLLTSWIIAG